MLNRHCGGFDFQGQGQVQAQPGFQAKKLNTCRKLELAANWAELKNQAEFAPGPDPDPKINFSKNEIRNYACSARERTACCVNICLRKVGCQNSNGPPDTL